MTVQPLVAYFSDPQFVDYFWNALLVHRSQLPGVFGGGIVNGPIWTLLYEAICYGLLIVAGVSGCLMRRRAFVAAVLLLIVLGWWAKGRHWYVIEPLGVHFPYVLRFIAYFAAGVALYVFRYDLVIDRWLAIGALVLSAVFLYLGMFHMFFPILGAYLVAYLGLQRWMDFTVLKGNDYSYGFYVYAFLVQQVVVSSMPGGATLWGNILMSVPLTLACAMLSWHLIEKPTLVWARNSDRSGPVMSPFLQKGSGRQA